MPNTVESATIIITTFSDLFLTAHAGSATGLENTQMLGLEFWDLVTTITDEQLAEGSLRINEIKDSVTNLFSAPDTEEEVKTCNVNLLMLARQFNVHLVEPIYIGLDGLNRDEVKEVLTKALDNWTNFSRDVHPDDALVARTVLQNSVKGRKEKIPAEV